MRRYVPIIGTHRAGKSYFLLTIANFVSRKKWGVVDESCRPYFHSQLEYVLRREPLPYTAGKIPIKLHINMIEYGGRIYKTNLTLATGDISGTEFETATKQIGYSISNLKDAPPVLKKFINILSNVDGIIAIIDIARELKSSINKTDAVLKAFASQIAPVAKGIELAMKFGKKMKYKPLFFVFTKKDIHGMDVDEIVPLFEKAWAILLRALEEKYVNIKYYATTSVGWTNTNYDSFFIGQGFDKLLYDLVVSL